MLIKAVLIVYEYLQRWQVIFNRGDISLDIQQGMLAFPFFFPRTKNSNLQKHLRFLISKSLSFLSNLQNLLVTEPMNAKLLSPIQHLPQK